MRQWITQSIHILVHCFHAYCFVAPSPRSLYRYAIMIIQHPRRFFLYIFITFDAIWYLLFARFVVEFCETVFGPVRIVLLRYKCIVKYF